MQAGERRETARAQCPLTRILSIQALSFSVLCGETSVSTVFQGLRKFVRHETPEFGRSTICLTEPRTVRAV